MGTWTDFAQFRAGAEVPGEDVVSAPDGSGFLVSNSMTILTGMSSDEWLAELELLVMAGPTQGCRESTNTASSPANRQGSRNIDGRTWTTSGEA